MTLPWLIQLLALGCLAGFLAGLLGIGGGMMLVPFLTYLLSANAGVESGLAIKMAVATSLATICFTSLSSLRAHHARGAVDWHITRWLAPGIVLGSLTGAQLAGWMPAKTLTIIFAAFVAFSSVQMFLNKKPRASRQLPKPLGLMGVGTGIGGVSSIVGAGGGFISVPFMVACNVPMHTAVGTSASLGLPIALAGTLGYVWAGWALPGLPDGALGFIHLPTLVCVASASVLTAPWGARTAHGMDTLPLKRAFASMLMLIAVYMAWKSMHIGP